MQKIQKRPREINFVALLVKLKGKGKENVEEYCKKNSEAEIKLASSPGYTTGAPNENIVQNHLNIVLVNVF